MSKYPPASGLTLCAPHPGPVFLHLLLLCVLALAGACSKVQAPAPVATDDPVAAPTQGPPVVSAGADVIPLADLIPLIDDESNEVRVYKNRQTGDLFFRDGTKVARAAVSDRPPASSDAATPPVVAPRMAAKPNVVLSVGGHGSGSGGGGGSGCTSSCWHMSEGGASCTGCCINIGNGFCSCWERCTDVSTSTSRVP